MVQLPGRRPADIVELGSAHWRDWSREVMGELSGRLCVYTGSVGVGFP